ncbi:MAG TPA: T9SS type A sorting domain-containing protein [Saprospiraceae bacterium]|nr:T9SS type A sorting domain-containing protein [Saprospiraceae bacterium]HMQ82484.1 T9SS type A sorting domain-containing protein [Saprospiraceae bacterium]
MTQRMTSIAYFVCLLVCSNLSAQNFEVYISDAGNFNLPPWKILKFDDDGENGQVFVSDHLAWPQDIFFIESDNVMLVTNLNTDEIVKFNATTGEYLGTFATGIDGPTRMELGADSLLYVLQWNGNGRVFRYQLDGTFVDEFTSASVTNSIGLDWDSAGNLHVSSYNTGKVRKFGTNGEDLNNFINANLSGPTNIWFGGNGDLFVCDWNVGSVKRFDSEGNYIGVFISGLPQVEGVDFFPNGDIIIGSGGLSSVRIYDSTGIYIRDLVPPGTLDMMTPNAVVLRPKLPINTTREVYEELIFVTPSVGTQFEFSNEALMGVKVEVYHSSGSLVQKINLTDSTSWDASGLAAGVYYLLAKLPNGMLGRQQVVVQH